MKKQHQQINYGDFRKKYVQLIFGEEKTKVIGELTKYCQNKIYLVEPNGNKRTFLDDYIISIREVQRPKNAAKVNYAEELEGKKGKKQENIERDIIEADKFIEETNTGENNKEILEEKIQDDKVL